jgi:hypothetical protein
VVKRNAVAALLAFVAIWPIAHRALVARYEIDPWKLGGFAMYATPTLPVLLGVLVEGEGEGAGRLVPLDESSLPLAARARLDRFRVERVALGRLREPRDAARAILAARPDLHGLVVLVQRTTLDPRSARTVASTQRFVYDRAVLEE